MAYNLLLLYAAMSYPYTVSECESRITAYLAAIDAHLSGTDAKDIQVGDTRIAGASLPELENGLTTWKRRKHLAAAYAASGNVSTIRPVRVKAT